MTKTFFTKFVNDLEERKRKRDRKIVINDYDFTLLVQKVCKQKLE